MAVGSLCSKETETWVLSSVLRPQTHPAPFCFSGAEWERQNQHQEIELRRQQLTLHQRTHPGGRSVTTGQTSAPRGSPHTLTNTGAAGNHAGVLQPRSHWEAVLLPRHIKTKRIEFFQTGSSTNNPIITCFLKKTKMVLIMHDDAYTRLLFQQRQLTDDPACLPDHVSHSDTERRRQNQKDRRHHGRVWVHEAAAAGLGGMGQVHPGVLRPAAGWPGETRAQATSGAQVEDKLLDVTAWLNEWMWTGTEGETRTPVHLTVRLRGVFLHHSNTLMSSGLICFNLELKSITRF